MQFLSVRVCYESRSTMYDWDCVAAVERLPALHYSVDFIFLSFGIIGFIVWPRKYAHSRFSSVLQSLLPKDTLLRTYLTVTPTNFADLESAASLILK